MPKTRKKMEDPRMTLAFYDDNMDFCKEMAYRSHLSVTQYVNQLISQEKVKHNKADWKPATREGGSNI